MARSFDNFPTYDKVVKEDMSLSNIWESFFNTFVESLQGYLSEYGSFIPVLTLEQQSEIQEPVEGQMIYVSDANSPTTPRTAQLQIWQIVAGVGQWTVIV